MRYRLLACDYDRTLTTTDYLDAEMVAALKRLRASGRKVVIITGRRLYQLNRFLTPEQAALFDYIVAENGGVIWKPGTDDIRLLTPPVSPRFVKALREAGIPANIGLTGVHVPLEHALAAQKLVSDLRLPVHAIRGTNHFVFLPLGVDKASGLRAVAKALGLPPSTAITMGDGYNDVAMLNRRHSGCGLGIAVGNAVDAARNAADYVAPGSAGTSVRAVIQALITRDLQAPRRDLGLAA